MIIQRLKPPLRVLRRALGLTPMGYVLSQLTSRGVPLARLDALEVFGARGEFHTLDYAAQVRSLEVWEVDPACEADLRRNLPRARVKITDAFAEIRTVPGPYGLIVIDNPQSTYGAWCEHFDLFPEVFRLVGEEGILVLNVIPQAPAVVRAEYPYLFNPEHLARRTAYYHTETPEQVALDHMAAVYTKLAEENGLRVDWWFNRRRALFVDYLVLHLTRRTPAPRL